MNQFFFTDLNQFEYISGETTVINIPDFGNIVTLSNSMKKYKGTCRKFYIKSKTFQVWFDPEKAKTKIVRT